ncbi:hypothetical protein IEO21_01282 [Rhodonia placenta]|uniref:Translation machinery-associated protein 16 n=1 Tax=Rhodonia placenta TaxID=104341 RepID=A0A8H7PA20_9APHY|nr:hypothetical protein IEO21_01282 [Postia placenta]
MAPPKAAAKASKKSTAQKKEKLFHPQSRKAGQLARVQHRKDKLTDLARARVGKRRSQVLSTISADIYSFFYKALPPEGVLSLEELHLIVRDIWMSRFDSEIEEEKNARRKGRPKSVKEQKLEEIKLREAEEYRTGLEVVDLTDPPNVELFRRWDQKEVAFIQQLRFIRIAGDAPSLVVISRPGQHPSLVQSNQTNVELKDQEMDTDDAPLLMEPLSRFASTIMTMDGTP